MNGKPRTDYEIVATKAYDGCPKRLVIVTSPEVFWTPESSKALTPPAWDPDRIRDTMEWTDFFQTTGTWDGMLVFCTEYARRGLLTPEFRQGWDQWAAQIDHLLTWELELWFSGSSSHGSVHNVASSSTTVSKHHDLRGHVSFYPADFGSSNEWDVWQEIITDYFGSTDTPWDESESLTDLFKRGATTVRHRPDEQIDTGVQEVIILEPAQDGKLKARAFELPYRQYSPEEMAELGLK